MALERGSRYLRGKLSLVFRLGAVGEFGQLQQLLAEVESPFSGRGRSRNMSAYFAVAVDPFRLSGKHLDERSEIARHASRELTAIACPFGINHTDSPGSRRIRGRDRTIWIEDALPLIVYPFDGLLVLGFR